MQAAQILARGGTQGGPRIYLYYCIGVGDGVHFDIKHSENLNRRSPKNAHQTLFPALGKNRNIFIAYQSSYHTIRKHKSPASISSSIKKGKNHTQFAFTYLYYYILQSNILMSNILSIWTIRSKISVQNNHRPICNSLGSILLCMH
jgi:hypothetical protein